MPTARARPLGPGREATSCPVHRDHKHEDQHQSPHTVSAVCHLFSRPSRRGSEVSPHAGAGFAFAFTGFPLTAATGQAADTRPDRAARIRTPLRLYLMSGAGTASPQLRQTITAACLSSREARRPSRSHGVAPIAAPGVDEPHSVPLRSRAQAEHRLPHPTRRAGALLQVDVRQGARWRARDTSATPESDAPHMDGWNARPVGVWRVVTPGTSHADIRGRRNRDGSVSGRTEGAQPSD
jgi:hypothetical protein